jgi:hypothetical protein
MKTITTCLIWILLLCLPLQGMAAMSLLPCQNISDAPVLAAPQAEDGHCHNEAPAGVGHCNAGGSCVPALLPSPPILTILIERQCASGPIAYISTFASDFFPDRLERPPLHTAI